MGSMGSSRFFTISNCNGVHYGVYLVCAYCQYWYKFLVCVGTLVVTAAARKRIQDLSSTSRLRCSDLQQLTRFLCPAQTQQAKKIKYPEALPCCSWQLGIVSVSSTEAASK